MISKFIKLMFSGTILVSMPALAEIDQKEFKEAFETYAKTDEGQKFIAHTVQRFFEKNKFGPSLDEQFEHPLDVNMLPLDEIPFKGNRNAPISIIVYADFECPFCRQANDTLNELLKIYKDKINIQFKNTPLPEKFHKNATEAASASIAAWKQGKFWEMHDELFAKQNILSPSLYEKAAAQLNLDMNKFKADMKSEDTKQIIDGDLAETAHFGITGRPAFMIVHEGKGILIKGNKPIDKFQEIIDRWIKTLE